MAIAELETAPSVVPLPVSTPLGAADIGQEVTLVGYGLTSAVRNRGLGTKRVTRSHISSLGIDSITLGNGVLDSTPLTARTAWLGATGSVASRRRG